MTNILTNTTLKLQKKKILKKSKKQNKKKLHHCFTVEQATIWAKQHPHLKGEVTLMIAPPRTSKKDPSMSLVKDIQRRAKICVQKGLSHKDLMTVFAHDQIPKKLLYKALLEVQESVTQTQE